MAIERGIQRELLSVAEGGSGGRGQFSAPHISARDGGRGGGGVRGATGQQ